MCNYVYNKRTDNKYGKSEDIGKECLSGGGDACKAHHGATDYAAIKTVPGIYEKCKLRKPFGMTSEQSSAAKHCAQRRANIYTPQQII